MKSKVVTFLLIGNIILLLASCASFWYVNTMPAEFASVQTFLDQEPKDAELYTLPKAKHEAYVASVEAVRSAYHTVSLARNSLWEITAICTVAFAVNTACLLYARRTECSP